MVMEKQNATKATNTGVIFIWNRSVRFKISIRENPTAADKKPFRVCNMVSQCLKIP